MTWRRRYLQSNFDLERRPGAREWNWLLLVPLAGREAHEESPR